MSAGFCVGKRRLGRGLALGLLAAAVSAAPHASAAADPAGPSIGGGSAPAAGRIAEKRQTLRVVATGYTAGEESTGKKPGHPSYGITSSGVKVRRGKLSTVAADPNVLPMGTLLYIPGYGYGVVADTGSQIKGYRLDLYFPSTREVFRDWGKRTVEVQILRKGTGKLDERTLRALSRALESSKES